MKNMLIILDMIGVVTVVSGGILSFILDSNVPIISMGSIGFLIIIASGIMLRRYISR